MNMCFGRTGFLFPVYRHLTFLLLAGLPWRPEFHHSSFVEGSTLLPCGT